SSVRNVPSRGCQIRVPTRSAGTRSGVNWMRRKVPPSTVASVRTVSVLARPGTPSRRTWPPVSSATSRRSSIASWPMTTRLHSYRAPSSAWRASAAGSVSGWGVMGSSESGWEGSEHAAEHADRRERGQEHQRERAAGEEARDLALLALGGDLRAEALVDLVERLDVAGRERAAAGDPGDIGERLRVRRHGLAAVDRAVRRAERDRVDRDLARLGRAGGGERIAAADRLAVGEQHD